MMKRGWKKNEYNTLLKSNTKEIKVEQATIAAVLFNWLNPPLPVCPIVLFPLCSLNSFSSFPLPLIFEWHYGALFISAEFSCCSFGHTHTRARARAHKTMSAGRLLLAARSSLRCIISAVLKGSEGGGEKKTFAVTPIQSRSRSLFYRHQKIEFLPLLFSVMSPSQISHSCPSVHVDAHKLLHAHKQ